MWAWLWVGKWVWPVEKWLDIMTAKTHIISLFSEILYEQVFGGQPVLNVPETTDRSAVVVAGVIGSVIGVVIGAVVVLLVGIVVCTMLGQYLFKRKRHLTFDWTWACWKVEKGNSNSTTLFNLSVYFHAIEHYTPQTIAPISYKIHAGSQHEHFYIYVCICHVKYDAEVLTLWSWRCRANGMINRIHLKGRSTNYIMLGYYYLLVFVQIMKFCLKWHSDHEGVESMSLIGIWAKMKKTASQWLLSSSYKKSTVFVLFGLTPFTRIL